MALTKTFVVANPRSAGGKLAKRYDTLLREIRTALGQVELQQTTAAGSATELTRQALAGGFERVLVAGGDGTINEVINGFDTNIAGAPRQPTLGIIPFGTGGDLSRSLEIPRDTRQALALIASQPDPRAFDVGLLRCQDRHGQQVERRFVNIASCGLSGPVVERVNASSKRLGGKLTFALATLAAMRGFEPPRLRIRIDDQPARDAAVHLLAVCNFRYFGGGMLIAPKAVGDDGHFDVVTIDPMGFASFLARSASVYSGKHVERADVHYERARKVVLEPLAGQNAVILDVDGETPGQLPAHFEIAPRALRVIVPSHVAG